MCLRNTQNKHVSIELFSETCSPIVFSNSQRAKFKFTIVSRYHNGIYKEAQRNSERNRKPQVPSKRGLKAEEKEN
jgi:hypothetical protein